MAKTKGKTTKPVLEIASVAVAETQISLTVKQEAFVQAYIETGSASAAYRRAYDVSAGTKSETVWEAASRLLSDRKVAARVGEMRGLIEDKTLFIAERAMSEYEDARCLAMNNGQPGAAVAAITGKVKLMGYMLERQAADRVRAASHSMSPILGDASLLTPDATPEQVDAYLESIPKIGDL